MLPFELTKDTHTSPFRASYGVSFMSTSTEIDRVIKGFYCSFVVLVLGKHTRCALNTLRPRQDGRHLPDDIFKCISLNENVWLSIEISLNFVCKGSINNTPALVQIMAWRWLGDKPLSEPMMVSLPTHTCVTRPQWVKLVNHQTKEGNLVRD